MQLQLFFCAEYFLAISCAEFCTVCTSFCKVHFRAKFGIPLKCLRKIFAFCAKVCFRRRPRLWLLITGSINGQWSQSDIYLISLRYSISNITRWPMITLNLNCKHDGCQNQTFNDNINLLDFPFYLFRNGFF